MEYLGDPWYDGLKNRKARKDVQRMEVENTLAKSITAAGYKAAYDAACKRLLANKIILAWIMKSCMEEYRDFAINEIAQNYIEGEPQIAQAAVHSDEETDSSGEQIKGAKTEDSTIKEGTVTYDIRFYATAPQTGEMIRLIINVEAQNDFYPGYSIVKRESIIAAVWFRRSMVWSSPIPIMRRLKRSIRFGYAQTRQNTRKIL